MAFGTDAGEEQQDGADSAHDEPVADEAVAAGSIAEGSDSVVLPEYLIADGANADPEAVSQS